MAFVYEAFRHSRRKLLICFVICLFVLGVFLHRSYDPVPSPLPVLQAQCDPDPPSNWDKLYKWEDGLPQHDVNLPFPEGKEGRYVYFHNQIQMLGISWTKCSCTFFVLFVSYQLKSEFISLMNTYLAYKSNRTYVFQDYIWRIEYYPWQHHLKRPWQPRTPLNALISGPAAGGAWDLNDPAPRSISADF